MLEQELSRGDRLIQEIDDALKVRGAIYQREGDKTPTYRRADIRYMKAKIAWHEWMLKQEAA